MLFCHFLSKLDSLYSHQKDCQSRNYPQTLPEQELPIDSARAGITHILCQSRNYPQTLPEQELPITVAQNTPHEEKVLHISNQIFVFVSWYKKRKTYIRNKLLLYTFFKYQALFISIGFFLYMALNNAKRIILYNHERQSLIPLVLHPAIQEIRQSKKSFIFSTACIPLILTCI